MLITFRDWKFSYFIAFLSRLSAWAELWKLRNRKMGVSLKRGRIEARVERFRKFKREKKGLLASQVLLWGWPERTRDGERRGARWRGGERGRRCVPCAWGCEDGWGTPEGREAGWTLRTEGPLLLSVRWLGRSSQGENSPLTARGQCSPACAPRTRTCCCAGEWELCQGGPSGSTRTGPGAQRAWRPRGLPRETWALLRTLLSPTGPGA